MPLIVGTETLKDIFAVSRSIQQTGKQIVEENKKLNQLKFFCKLAEKKKLFDVKMDISKSPLQQQHQTLCPQSLSLNFRFVHEDDVIEDGFFLLRVQLRTRRCSFDKLLHLRQLR